MITNDVATAVDAALCVVEAVDEPWLYQQTSGLAPKQDIEAFRNTEPARGYPELVIYDRKNVNAWLLSSAFLDPMEVSYR